jgi:hypothetical protein
MFVLVRVRSIWTNLVVMKARMHVLVPSFEPPKSAAIFESSFAQRTSLLLQMNTSNTSSSDEILYGQQIKQTHASTIVQNSKRSNSTSTKPPSSASLNLFGGSMRYTMPQKKSEEHNARNSQQTKIHSPLTRDRSPSSNIMQHPQHHPPQHQHQLPKEAEAGKKRTMMASLISGSSMDNNESKRTKKISTAAPGNTLRTLKQAAATRNQSVSTKNDFSLSVEGIDIFCRNVGACSEALDAFESLCNSSEAFSLALIFLDGTTTHVETSVKLCVPSKPCRQWNCLCDRHIRARHGVSPLLGAAVCIQGQEEYVYFLSLTNKLDSLIHSATSVEERWDNLLAIMCGNVAAASDSGSRKVSRKVMFNAQVGLMPLLHKLKTAGQQFTDMMRNNRNNLFDVKIASHLCDSNLSDQELEVQSISDRCGARAVHDAHTDLRVMGSVTKVLRRLHGELQCLLQVCCTLEADMEEKHLLDCFYQIEMPIGACAYS